MYHSDDFLERIRQTEISKLHKFSLAKLFSNVNIETTKEYGGGKNLEENLEEKQFKHTPISKYLFLLLAILISFKAIKDTFFISNTGIFILVLEYIFSIFFYL